ncbi:reverse transcriptase domain-containing protein [Tanacetum coccineum]
MPTWCHMFHSTLTVSTRVWFDDLPSESVDSYDDLEKVFLANFLQQKKCIKDPIEIHHIKQKEGNSTEDLVQRFNLKITISIQWDHREARSKKNSGGPINNYGMLNSQSQEELSHYEAVSLSHSSARWSQNQKYSLPPATESWKKESKWQFIWNTQSKQ